MSRRIGITMIFLAASACAGITNPRCVQPVFTTDPGHFTPPIGIVCHG